jgi:hypothetical protein
MNSTFNSFGSQVMTYTNCRFKEQPWIVNVNVNTLPHYIRTSALSETGKYQLITPLAGSTSFSTYFYSTDYGNSWVTRSLSGVNSQTASCGMDSTGKYQLISTGVGAWLSNNFGEIWTNVYTGWSTVIVSPNGANQMCIGDGAFGYSTNYGIDWATNLTFPLNMTYSISMCFCNCDSTYVTCCFSKKYMAYSSNSGSTWKRSIVSPFITEAATETHDWQGCSMSASGQYQVACTGTADSQNTTPAKASGIYYSSDFGAKWTKSTSSAIAGINWGTAYNGSKCIKMSSNGKLVIAISQSLAETIYCSVDYGQTWTKTTSPSLNWGSLAMSVNGTYILAASSTINQKLYYSVKFKP